MALIKKDFEPGLIDEWVLYLVTKYKKRISNDTAFKEFDNYFTTDISEATNMCYFWPDVLEEFYKHGWIEDDIDFINPNYEAPKKTVRVAKGQTTLFD